MREQTDFRANFEATEGKGICVCLGRRHVDIKLE